MIGEVAAVTRAYVLAEATLEMYFNHAEDVAALPVEDERVGELGDVPF
jgi:hypothetical protein